MIKVRTSRKTPDRDLEKMIARDMITMPAVIIRLVETPFSDKRRSFCRHFNPDREERFMRARMSPMAKGMTISR